MNEICHIEIPALDVNRAAKFYEDLFGWKMTRWGDGEDYILFNTGKEPSGGIMRVEEVKEGSLIIYIYVEDIPEALGKAETLGAERIQEKMEIPNVGFWGSFRDTEGNVIGLFSKK